MALLPLSSNVGRKHSLFRVYFTGFLFVNVLFSVGFLFRVYQITSAADGVAPVGTGASVGIGVVVVADGAGGCRT